MAVDKEVRSDKNSPPLRSDSPEFSALRTTRWNRGLKEHRKNGETEYVGNPPEVEALEELTDLVNYLMLMQLEWDKRKLGARERYLTLWTVEITEIYAEVAKWAEQDRVDMSSLWPSERESSNT